MSKTSATHGRASRTVRGAEDFHDHLASQDKEKMQKNKDERARFGRFYYRFPQGESGADVYDRVSTWLESLFREMSYGALDDQVRCYTGVKIMAWLPCCYILLMPRV